MKRGALTWAFTALGLLLAVPAYATDTVYYYSSDTVHSEVVITDASRNVVERTHYAPYGQVLNRDLRDGPGYTGHEEDPETNLVYMQQRYYDPEAGRFLSTDPVQADGGGGSFNRYAYANDNPYRYTDPDGRESGAGYATGEYTVALPPSSPEARDAALTMVGMAPVVGDVQNVVDAYNNPSVFNIAVAVVGLVPEGGTAVADIAKVAKIAKEGETVAKVGKATSKIERSAFAKERTAYWKTEAKANPEKYSSNDITKMEKGRAPTGPDGHPMELHHNDRTPNGGITPMSRTDHRLGENYKRNHPDGQR